MSLSINNNSSSLVALEALNAAQAELSKTENTISTGKKVDNAADSPAIYSIAAQMNGTLQGMTAVSDSLSLGAQVVATANTAGNKIMTSLQTLQNTVTAAGQTGTDASAMATQILSTLDSINSYARNATFSGVNLLTSGGDAVNAYNGTTLQTIVNVQGQTETFSSVVGKTGTLVDKLGLTSDSASGSSTVDSTQNIFSALNSSNVTHVDTSAMTTSDIVLGDGTAGGGGTTVMVGNNTFEFVQSGKAAQKGNIAVSLDDGFSVKSAMSALVSSLNGSGIAASVNGKDGSLSIQGASTLVSTNKPQYSVDLSAASAGATVTVGTTTYKLLDADTATAKTVKTFSQVPSGNGMSLQGSKLVSTDNFTATTDGTTAVTTTQSNSIDLSNLKAGDTVTVGAVTYHLGTGTNDTNNKYVANTATLGSTVVSDNANFTYDNNTLTDTGVTTFSANMSGSIVNSKASYSLDTSSLSDGATITSSGVTYTYHPDTATQKYVSSVAELATSSGLKNNAGVLSGTTNFSATTNGTTPVNVTRGATVNDFVASSGKAIDQIAVGIKGGVTAAVSSLQSAITNMSSVMQTVGNYSNTLTGMATYTKSLTDAVTNGVSALTDADMAAASAKLTSLQTKQSLAIKSLTIANGQSQNILSLFQG